MHVTTHAADPLWRGVLNLPVNQSRINPDDLTFYCPSKQLMLPYYALLWPCSPVRLAVVIVFVQRAGLRVGPEKFVLVQDLDFVFGLAEEAIHMPPFCGVVVLWL